MSKKWLLAACVSLVASSLFVSHAFAAEPAASPEDTVRKAVQSIANVKIDSLKPAPMPGYYQVIASGQLVYVSADGKYLINGDVVDIGSRKNLSEAEWATFRKAELAKLPVSDRIVFAPEKPRYTVSVFTDVTCAYCRELHKHIADFNKAGIAVQYIAWPREGLTTTSGRPTDTYKEMVSVWCAADRKAAFTEGMAGKAPKATTCDNPVKAEFDLGERVGVNGTPMVVAEDGRVLGGYMTPAQLLEKLTTGS